MNSVVEQVAGDLVGMFSIQIWIPNKKQCDEYQDRFASV